MTYLDHAATTPVLPEVLAAMTEQLGRVGNASSLHASGRAARRAAEQARERLAEALGARPSEVLFTGGGTESDNLAVKGMFWARREADSRRRRIVVSPAEHHAVLDSVEWLAKHDGAEITWLPVEPSGRVRPEALAEALGNGTDVAVASVMWANNEIGTVNDVPALVAVAHEVGVPLHTDAVQAIGQVPVDFGATGVDALTMTGHKLGGPMGAGVLLLRRDADCTPLLHGGGQERDVRSGTLDVAAIVGLAVATVAAVGSREERAERLAGLRGRLVAGVVAEVPDVQLNGAPLDDRLPSGPGPAARQRAPVVPGRRGRRAADAPRRPRHRVLDRLGVQRRRGAAQPRAARDRRRHRPGPQLAAVQPRPHVHGRRRRRGARGDRCGGRAGPSRRAGIAMRVLAAMSGGVDSAVAAALAVDAGHDVTGVHLALSPDRQTLRSGARGCCSVEDAHDARRVADELGIPFYVWDLADRFREDVVDDFVAEYAAGRTPNPCLRCNEKIKFTAVLDRARALGFDAVVTGHHARLSDGALRRSVDAAKDQSYVLGVLTEQQLAAAMFPLGSMTKERVREIAAERGFAVAAKPDSHDICFIPDGDTRGFLARKLGSRPGPVVDAATGATVGEHEGTYGFTVGQRRGLGVSAGDQRPRYVLAIEPVSRTVTIGTEDLAGVTEVLTARPTWTGSAPELPFAAQVQLRAHATPVACEVDAGDDGGLRIGSTLSSAGSPRDSPRCCTSRTPSGATGCSDRRPCRPHVNAPRRFVTSSWIRDVHGLASVTSRLRCVIN